MTIPKPDVAEDTGRSSRRSGEARIIKTASAFFAEHGFRASTRALSRRLGTTQPLIYRYFSSKQALIDRVFEEAFRDVWDPKLSDILVSGSGSLQQRLTQFYIVFLRQFDDTCMRLFLRASLDDRRLAESYELTLKDNILMPVIEALRRELGLPELRRKFMRRAEQELAMTLHACIMQLGIRKFVQRAPLPDDLNVHVAFYVRVFLSGALSALRSIHQDVQNGRLAAHLKFGLIGR